MIKNSNSSSMEMKDMEPLKGLSYEEAVDRLKIYGPNVLPGSEHSIIKLIAKQLKGIFNILLLVAAIVTFFMNEMVDFLFILGFFVVGISLNVYQEHKSNLAAEKLKKYLQRMAIVIRDGEEIEVPIDRVVPGDIIILETGDIVPADSVIRKQKNILVDESTFTGESEPASKEELDLNVSVSQDPKYILLQGSVIIRGNAVVQAITTGSKTKLFEISKTASEVEAESELIEGVDRISKFILWTTILTLAVVLLANILIEDGAKNITQLIIFAIALSVSVIPEALPLVMTFSLSRGALQFAAKSVIVKRLSSVQDLGAVNLICTDKTGTITENKLACIDTYRDPQSQWDPLVLARLAAHGLNERTPEPFDLAVDEAMSTDQKYEFGKSIILEEEAFDPSIRSNGAVVKLKDGNILHIRRGGIEYFFSLGVPSTKEVNDWIINEEVLGRRVLAIGYEYGERYRLAGLISFADTLKQTTKETLLQAEKLNVDITIITGDSIRVAEAVGREIGLITDRSQIIDTSDFLSLPEKNQQDTVGRIRVFSRATPDQKLKLIRMLKHSYNVAYLGDGVNDAPALKAANVSMVVNTAADVARETADIVLLEKDLRVIVDGIKLGRETFANTMKYIRITLVSNFGNFYALAIGLLIVDFLPMLPKQLLLLNLLSDFPMMSIAFDKVNSKEIEKPMSYNFHTLYFTFVSLGLVSTVFDFIYFSLFYRISPGVLQTNWFIASVITELMCMISLRTMEPFYKAGKPSNVILGLAIVAGSLAVAIPLVPWSAKYFDFVQPGPNHLITILGVALSYFIVTEIVKRPIARLRK